MATSAGDEDFLRLDVYTGDTVATHVLPSSGKVFIGRAEDNDVRVDHPSVSRRHAALHLGPPLRIEDLGGSNGTSIQSTGPAPSDGSTEDLLRISRRSVEIAVGSSINLGTVMMVVRRIVPEVAGDGFVVRDRAMVDLYEQAYLAANAPISVLILGETGVGKDVMARAIHQRSSRAAKPFLGLHCAALPESLLESELFGHEKGSFTGATSTRPGLFEAANGGTVFLDEIGELPMSIQVKLLRLLETREVMRVGGRAPIRIDVRFVSATHRDLEGAVAAGSFRADLYYRLNGMTLTIPPLRARAAEIEPLASRFLALTCRELDRPALARISPDARMLLERYPWPGNVRELKNAIERAIVLCRGDVLLPEHLPPRIADGSPATRPPDDPDERERRRVLDALDKCGGNQTRAAELLGVSRRTLVYRLSSYGLTKRRRRSDPPADPGEDDSG